jgi:hypothetical protein
MKAITALAVLTLTIGLASIWPLPDPRSPRPPVAPTTVDFHQSIWGTRT